MNDFILIAFAYFMMLFVVVASVATLILIISIWRDL